MFMKEGKELLTPTVNAKPVNYFGQRLLVDAIVFKKGKPLNAANPVLKQISERVVHLAQWLSQSTVGKTALSNYMSENPCKSSDVKFSSSCLLMMDFLHENTYGEYVVWDTKYKFTLIITVWNIEKKMLFSSPEAFYKVVLGQNKGAIGALLKQLLLIKCVEEKQKTKRFSQGDSVTWNQISSLARNGKE